MKDKITLEVPDDRVGLSGCFRKRTAVTLTRKELEDALAEINKKDLPQAGDKFTIESALYPGRHLGSKDIYVVLDKLYSNPLADFFQGDSKNVWGVNLRTGCVSSFNSELFNFTILKIVG